MAGKKVLTIGSVLKRKDGNGHYIKINQDIKLEKGEIINVDDPRTLPDNLLAAGVISEERFKQLKSKSIPDFVMFDLTVRRAQSE